MSEFAAETASAHRHRSSLVLRDKRFYIFKCQDQHSIVITSVDCGAQTVLPVYIGSSSGMMSLSGIFIHNACSSCTTTRQILSHWPGVISIMLNYASLASTLLQAHWWDFGCSSLALTDPSHFTYPHIYMPTSIISRVQCHHSRNLSQDLCAVLSQ